MLFLADGVLIAIHLFNCMPSSVFVNKDITTCHKYQETVTSSKKQEEGDK